MTGDQLGPIIAAREQLGDHVVHEAFLEFVHDVNEADDGTMRFRGEYLVSVARPG